MCTSLFTLAPSRVGKVSPYHDYILQIILEKFVKVPCLFFISLRLSRGSCFDLLSMILVFFTLTKPSAYIEYFKFTLSHETRINSFSR